MVSVFLYGTLRHLPLLDIVADRAPEALAPEPARLDGHRVAWAAGQGFPLIEERAGAACEGLLLRDVPGDVLARLDFYELGFGYGLRDVTVDTAAGPVAARVYFPEPGLWQAGDDWSLDDWVRDVWPVTRHAAREIMEYFGKLTGAEVAARFGMIQTRAAARHMAGAAPAPARLRSATGAGEVETAAAEMSHAGYFLTRTYRLRHPLFAGGMSEWLSREVFVSGDVALVLPYDAKRDRVMVIEQFRMGPFARGDARPWLLEPIAGRIEAHESAAQSALREAREEAGIGIGALERVGSFYASPGYSTEYFNCFVGLADLPDAAAGQGGVADEHEDIRSHVLGFDAATELMESGEINNAPLVLMLLWLGRERARLRREAG